MKEFNPYKKLMSLKDYRIIKRAEYFRSTNKTIDNIPCVYGWYVDGGKYISIYASRSGALHTHCAPAGHRIAHGEPQVLGHNKGYFIITLPGELPQEVITASKIWDRIRRRYYDKLLRNEQAFSIEDALAWAIREHECKRG